MKPTMKSAALVCALLGSALSPVAAQAPTTRPENRISLEEALRAAEAANLELRVAREQFAAAEARTLAAAAFPNPGAAATREQLSAGGDSYYETVATLSQTIEIGGQRGARIAGARQAEEAGRARLVAERLRIAFAVHRAYVRAAAAESDLLALTDATEVFRQVEQSGRARFAEGDISQFDRNRLQVERARYETLLAAKVLELDEAGRELTMLAAPEALGTGAALLPAEPLADIAAVEETVVLSVALETALTRADVLAAEAEVEARRAALSLARRDRIPDLTLTGGFKHQADGFQGAVLGLSLPVPLWNRNGGAIAEAEAELAAAAARRDLAVAQARNDIRRAWERYRSLEERTRTVGETLLPESAGLLETARFAYSEEEMSLIELLDAADAYRGARESVNALLGDYLIAVFDLQRATGRLLDNRALLSAPASR